MEANQPIVNIAGDLYRVDIIQGRLDLSGAERKRKPLMLRDMYQHDDRYRLLYDKRDKAIFTITPDTWRLPDEVVLAELCSKAMLDPATYARQKGQKPDMFGPYVLQLAETERIALIMPRYNIGGHQFFVIPFERVFVDTVDLSNRISFRSFKKEGDSPAFIDYNTKTCTVAGHSPKEDRTAVVRIELPSQEILRKLEQESEQYRQRPALIQKRLPQPRALPPPHPVKSLGI